MMAETFRSLESTESKKAHQHDEWDPEWTVFYFTAWAKCNDPKCGEEAALAGVGGFEPTWGPDGETGWTAEFTPHCCRPMPYIIGIPAKCPSEVRSGLQAAFALFWSDRAAAAGRVRVALDHLMDHLGIPKQVQQEAKLITYDLHRRIELFAERDAQMGSRLMALKWLGNTGSHERAVSRDDLLDAFEVLEHALLELIDRRTANVDALALKLTRKHAPNKN